MSRKNPFKGAIILTVVAAVAAGLYFVLRPVFEKSESSVDNATLLYGGLGRNEIYELRIHNPASTIDVKKRADRADSWTVSPLETNAGGSASGAATPSYDADPTSVNGIISTILAARKEQAITNVKPESVGLSPALFELTVSHGDQKKTLLLGSDTPVDYLVYAQWAGSPDIFLTSRSLRFGIDKKISELRDKKIFDLKIADLKEIRIQPLVAADFKVLKGLHFQKDDKGVWTALSTGKPIAVKSGEISNLLDTFNKSTVKDFASEKVAERESLGFKKPVLEIDFIGSGSDAKPKVWKLAQIIEPQGDAKKTKYYLGETSADATFEMNPSFRDAFEVDLMKFRDTTITQLNSNDVSAVTIHSPKDKDWSLSLVKQGSEWKIKSGETLENAKPEKVTEILSKIGQLRAGQYFDDGNTRKLGLDKPSRVVEIFSAGKTPSTKTLFFGKLLEPATYAVSTEGLSSPASVKLDVENVFPPNIEAYRNNAPKAAAHALLETKKGKKVKLEPNVTSPKEVRKLPAPIVKPGHRYTGVMKLSNGKELEIEFAADKAPYTVSNFLHLARNHFYDNVVFHRVIRDFVIQGGDPTGTGTGGPGYKFDNEDNDLKHVRGSLSMAHAGRNTNGSQFFIVLQPQSHLNGLHTVFGKVTKGEELLDQIPQGTKMNSVEVFEEAL